MDGQIFSITIGRELGSGGREIARLLAEHFGCKFFDKEIFALAAKESGFSEKLFEEHDEKHGKLHNLVYNKVPIIGHANYFSEQVTQGSLFQFQSEVIWYQAKENRCVFVGRGADYILREKDNVARIFVYADLEYKIARVAERNNITEDEARKLIRTMEKARAEYYNFYTGKQWGSKESYDLCINSCALGINQTADYLANFITFKFNL